MVTRAESAGLEIEFTGPFLTRFSERFKQLKIENPRRDVEKIFKETCRELRIFELDKINKLRDIFFMKRICEIPLEIIADNRVEEVSQFSSRFDTRRDYDRHELQLPRGDRD